MHNPSSEIRSVANQVAELTEIKTPGAGAGAYENGPDIKTIAAGEFDAEKVATIQSTPPPVTEKKEGATADQVTTTAGSDPKYTFDHSGTVELIVRNADLFLQRGFDWLDRATTLHAEDRQALNYLLFKTRNGLLKSTDLTDYGQWLMAQGNQLSTNSDQRKASEEELRAIIEAAKAMPWVKDHTMTPEKAFGWAVAMYFFLRLLPIGFNLMNGKATAPPPSPEELTPKPETQQKPPQQQQFTAPPPVTHTQAKPQPVKIPPGE